MPPKKRRTKSSEPKPARAAAPSTKAASGPAAEGNAEAPAVSGTTPSSVAVPFPIVGIGASAGGLAAYEAYRAKSGVDPEFVAADRIRDESGCVLRYDRSFMRPMLPAAPG